jgi:hypothetical protein
MFTFHQINCVYAEQHFLLAEAVFEKLINCDFGAVPEHVDQNVKDSGQELQVI